MSHLFDTTQSKMLVSEMACHSKSYSKQLPISQKLEAWTTRLLFFICCSILCTTVFFHTWKKSEARRFGFLVDGALKRKANLLEQYKKLKLQMESLQHPQRLAKIAMDELNMQAPSLSNMVSKLAKPFAKKKVHLAHNVSFSSEVR